MKLAVQRSRIRAIRYQIAQTKPYRDDHQRHLLLQVSVQQEQPVAVPAPVPQPVLPAAAPADSGAPWKLEGMERRQQELQAERSLLLQEVAKLKSALAKRDSEGERADVTLLLPSQHDWVISIPSQQLIEPTVDFLAQRCGFVVCR